MKQVIWLGIMLAFLAGCQSMGRKGGETAEGAAAQAEGVTTKGLAGEEGAALYEVQTQGISGQEGVGPDATGLLARRTIYFDFDSAQVRSEDLPIIQAHARYLAANPQARVTLEGHTDERGSREYNIALGEARAKAVARLLELNGVRSDRIRIVSYGEEKPVALGHDESAWQKNRRVEIVYGSP